MQILLPPSETKRPGGSRRALDVTGLALPQLSPQRERVVAALVALSASPEQAMAVLKLSERQRGEVEVNAALRSTPTMPAIDRYTGVLFDAMDAASLDTRARQWLGRSVLIHSAPFGPVGALDRIPAYRLGASASLPGLPSLRALWADAVTAAFAQTRWTFTLDLRSEAYVALGPLPAEMSSAYVRVVADGPDGPRALNHFNKHAKGVLVRRLAEDRPRIGSLEAFIRWAESRGIAARPGAAGEVAVTA
ncbi:YaaA family protein [Microbacterium koreense]|uniref:YaaA family protein n=1 Tax=Microbacterium koreense TaxID=323761 RepID=A0ABW2ZTI5_9MICO